MHYTTPFCRLGLFLYFCHKAVVPQTQWMLAAKVSMHSNRSSSYSCSQGMKYSQTLQLHCDDILFEDCYPLLAKHEGCRIRCTITKSIVTMCLFFSPRTTAKILVLFLLMTRGPCIYMHAVMCSQAPIVVLGAIFDAKQIVHRRQHDKGA